MKNYLTYAAIMVLFALVSYLSYLKISNLENSLKLLKSENETLISINQTQALKMDELNKEYLKGLETLSSANKDKEIITKVIEKQKIIAKGDENNESVPKVINDTTSFILDRLRSKETSSANTNH
ncbi:hypothetical protein [Campylobacter sputorum]|uniref:hypothetical protein n=1 Tax=Campylobacter sputorum TaxID=206 RepID=UPI00053C0494|nr:hypothetical protein [Campylobacter sputorum]